MISEQQSVPVETNDVDIVSRTNPAFQVCIILDGYHQENVRPCFGPLLLWTGCLQALLLWSDNFVSLLLLD